METSAKRSGIIKPTAILFVVNCVVVFLLLSTQISLRRSSYGLKVGDSVAYVAPDGDDLLRMLLAETGNNVRFTSGERLCEALERYIRSNAVPGFESGVAPQLVRYFYDGLSLRSEKEVSVGVDRECGHDYRSDWTAIGMLRDEGEKIRSELERRAGVPEGRHFRFGKALYPALGIRDDALFLTSRTAALTSSKA